MLWQILNNIGFNEKESKIYLALLETSAQPASVVTRQSGINRTTTYLTLEDLLKKGIVNRFERKSIQYFEAVDPKQIINILENQKIDLEEKKNYLKKQIPKLESIAQTDSTKPRVSYFEGFEAIMNLYADSLNGDHKEIFSFLRFDKIPPRIVDYLEKYYLPKRLEKEIFVKIISSKPKEDAIWMDKEHQAKHLREIKCYDLDLPIQIEMFIYGDKMSFICLDENQPFGIQIKNKTIIESIKGIQELLWKIL